MNISQIAIVAICLALCIYQTYVTTDEFLTDCSTVVSTNRSADPEWTRLPAVSVCLSWKALVWIYRERNGSIQPPECANHPNWQDLMRCMVVARNPGRPPDSVTVSEMTDVLIDWETIDRELWSVEFALRNYTYWRLRTTLRSYSPMPCWTYLTDSGRIHFCLPTINNSI